MRKEKYKQIVEKHSKKENRLYNAITSFVIGGFMGVLGELLIEFYAYFFDLSTKDASVFMIITLVF